MLRPVPFAGGQRGDQNPLCGLCGGRHLRLSGAECMCGASDNSKGTITGYASTKKCVKGADAFTAGAFSTTVAACTASATDEMAAQCTTWVVGQTGDAAAGAFCGERRWHEHALCGMYINGANPAIPGSSYRNDGGI